MKSDCQCTQACRLAQALPKVTQDLGSLSNVIHGAPLYDQKYVDT